jgi:hypothetical protein
VFIHRLWILCTFFHASSRKVVVIEDQDILKRVGTLPTADRKLVAEQLREYLAIG